MPRSASRDQIRAAYGFMHALWQYFDGPMPSDVYKRRGVRAIEWFPDPLEAVPALAWIGSWLVRGEAYRTESSTSDVLASIGVALAAEDHQGMDLTSEREAAVFSLVTAMVEVFNRRMSQGEYANLAGQVAAEFDDPEHLVPALAFVVIRIAKACAYSVDPLHPVTVDFYNLEQDLLKTWDERTDDRFEGYSD